MVESLGFNFPINYDTYCQGAHISTEVLRDLIYTSCKGLKEAHPNWMEIREIKQKIYLKHLQNGQVELMPGVDILIQSLIHFQKKACIVTNSPLEQIELVEAKLPLLKKIPFKITRNDYTHPKPSGDSYRVAIEKYGSPTDRIIGFEDSQKGVMALIDAKVFSIEINPSSSISLADKKFPDFQSINFA